MTVVAMRTESMRALVGNAEAFPILKQWDFFNHAGVSPLAQAAAEAMRKYAAQAEEVAYLHTGWYRDIEQLRTTSAAMLNAKKDEIAFIKNTSEGIAIVASGLEWQWGDRIVTTNIEYPANIYPWMEVARSRGAKLVMVEERDDENGRRHVPTDAILEAASEPKTKIVTLSHVEFASGQRHDLARIGEFCRQRGIHFCVDAIQSLGVLPVDVQAMNIDFLSADGHKWLMGPEGAGVFYCRKQLVERVRPALIGWMNVVNAMEYGNYNYTLRPDAGRFECGSYNVAGLLSLKASMEMLVALGPGKVSQRLRELTDRLIEGLERKGYKIVSPRDKWQWSGIVSFVSPNADSAGHQRIFQTLRQQHRTEIAFREGRLRASPHFYNTEEQMDRLVERLPPV